jgi:hypothetical protein
MQQLCACRYPYGGKRSGVEDEKEEVRRVTDAIKALDEIPDLEERVRARNRVLAAQAEVVKAWHTERRELVLSLRAEDPPVPIRKIAERLAMSAGVVQDIIKGHTGSWKNRPPREAAGE